MNLSVIIPIAIAVAALIVAIITAYYNKKAVPSPPQEPELTVDITVTPLLPHGASEVHGKIKIQYEDGGLLTDPRLIEVILHNTGTAAVSEEMYDGHPYVVRFGTKVVGQLLRQGNSAVGKSTPAVALTNNELRIGPGAIHADQRLTYAVLVDGQESVEQTSPLLNIDVQRSADRSPRPDINMRIRIRRNFLTRWWELLVIPVVAGGVALLFLYDDVPKRQTEPPTESTIGNCRLNDSTLACTVSTTPSSGSTPAR